MFCSHLSLRLDSTPLYHTMLMYWPILQSLLKVPSVSLSIWPLHGSSARQNWISPFAITLYTASITFYGNLISFYQKEAASLFILTKSELTKCSELWTRADTTDQRPPSPAMNPSCQPAPGVMGVFKTSFSSERVGGGTRYRRHPRRWALTSTAQHLIYRLVQRSKPLVLQRGRNVIYMYWCFVFLIFVWYKQTIHVPFPVVWRQPGWNSLLDMLFLWHSWRHTRQEQRLTSSYAVYSTVCLWERSESEVQLINIDNKMTEWCFDDLFPAGLYRHTSEDQTRVSFSKLKIQDWKENLFRPKRCCDISKQIWCL